MWLLRRCLLKMSLLKMSHIIISCFLRNVRSVSSNTVATLRACTRASSLSVQNSLPARQRPTLHNMTAVRIAAAGVPSVIGTYAQRDPKIVPRG